MRPASVPSAAASSFIPPTSSCQVAVARAIVNNPKIILADEPTGNLDSANGDDVMKTLVHLNQEGATIIMVTHSQYCAEFGNRIIRMLDGQVVTENVVKQYL